jgi:Skp family chaperone for outer membrane proteins
MSAWCKNWGTCCAFALLLSLKTAYAQTPSALIVDSRDAYARVPALKQLLSEVDQKIRAARGRFEAEAAPHEAALAALKKSGQPPENTRKQKAELLLKIAALQKAASLEQQRIGRANEAALAEFEKQLALVSAEIKRERKASALLMAQDVIYYRPDCPCNVTEEVYKRINTRMPRLTLAISDK